MQHSRHLTKLLGTLLAAAGIALTGAPVLAQGVSQYMPLVTYRTGPYGPSGTPAANGLDDYYKLVNARGGINGVKLDYEECETGYDTARTVECYERLKTKNGGAVVFQPWSTGITFAMTEKAPPTRSRWSSWATAAATRPTARSSSGTSRGGNYWWATT
jgi:branched-chain amino acid transport system substrate-binding protein